MNDKDALEARLRGVESALDKLESEYNRGTIEIGRYLQLKKELEAERAGLEQQLARPVPPPASSLEKEPGPTPHPSPSQAGPTAKEPVREPSGSLWDRFKRWLPIAVIGLAVVLIVLVSLLSRDGGEDKDVLSSPTDTLAAVTSVTSTSTDTPRPTFTPTPTATNTPMSTPTRTPAPTPTSTSAPSPTSTPTLAPALIALRTFHERYVTAMDDQPKPDGGKWDWELRGYAERIEAWEIFTLIWLDDDTVALKTYHNRYVTAMDENANWIIRAGTTDLLACEKFKLHYLDNDRQVAFETCHGKYVSAREEDDGWLLRGLAEEIKDWEIFELIFIQ